MLKLFGIVSAQTVYETLISQVYKEIKSPWKRTGRVGGGGGGQNDPNVSQLLSSTGSRHITWYHDHAESRGPRKKRK